MGISKNTKSIENYNVAHEPALFGTKSNYSSQQQEDLLRGDVFVRVPSSELERLRVSVHTFLL